MEEEETTTPMSSVDTIVDALREAFGEEHIHGLVTANNSALLYVDLTIAGQLARVAVNVAVPQLMEEARPLGVVPERANVLHLSDHPSRR